MRELSINRSEPATPCPHGRTAAGCAWLLIACLLTMGIRARADVVVPSGKPAQVGVTVTGFERAQLIWRGPDGSERSHPIEDVAYLQITGWSDFNAAERQLREQHPQQAVAGYQKALAAMANAAAADARSLDRLTLLLCRLLRAALADGQHETAVNTYIQLLEGTDGPALRGLQPRRVPEAGDSQFAAAARLLAAAIERHGDDAVGQILREWRRAWPAAAADVRAPAAPAAPPTRVAAPARVTSSAPAAPAFPAAPAVSVAPEPPASAPAGETIGGTLERAQALLRAGKPDECLKMLADLHARATGLERAEFWYWEAQAHLARSAATTEAAPRERRRAGLALMRVAVHFPASPRAPEALYAAGRICQEDGQTAQARTLWSELVGRYSPRLACVERARQDLGSIDAEQAMRTASQPATTIAGPSQQPGAR